MAGQEHVDWSQQEVEATISDYFSMLSAELSAAPYSKAEHRRALLQKLNNRSPQSVEFKHANISAVLIELGFPYIAGYKPRSNYQGLLYEVVSERLTANPSLLSLAAADAERSVVVPSIDDILKLLTEPPKGEQRTPRATDKLALRRALPINYLEREARNRNLGAAGEEFVLNFERARLIHAGRDKLAGRIDHVSRTQGDGAGFDILSFELSGADRLIEVKTTKYGRDTPFFVSRNEVDVSQTQAGHYHLYRVFEFRRSPRLFTLAGALSTTCELQAACFMARVS